MTGSRSRVIKIVFGSIGGGLLALSIGLLVVDLAPENGFGDLVAATLTAIVLVPIGVVAGAASTYMRTRSRG